MENQSESDSTERNFGHCIITWEIKNYGLAVWQKDWEAETPEFSVCGPGSWKTKWQLILQTYSNETCYKQKESVETSSKQKSMETGHKWEKSVETGPKREESVETCPEREESVEVDCIQEDSITLNKSELRSGNLVLNLERSQVDEELDIMWVDLKVYCLGADGEKYAIAQGQHLFDCKNRYGLNLGTLFDLEREFQYNSGVMTFLCQMIVHDRNIPVNFDGTLDIDLCALSEDFHWAFTQKKFCDVAIKLGEKSILAHKAILSSRCKSFESMITKEDLEVIDLSDADYDGIMKTLEYMYSSDLQCVIDRPSISIYDSINRMNILDLVDHYIPQKQKIRTKIDIKKLTYMWLIKDFSAKEGDCISSPIVCKDLEDAAWQINIYPRGLDGKSKYVTISVEYLGGKIEDDLCVQCAVLRKDATFQSWKTLQRSIKDDRKFEDEEFIHREALLKTLNNDSLRLGFKVRMCAGKEHSLDITASPHVLCTKEKSLKRLSEDMLSLRRSNKYTDVVLNVGKEEIKAHKFVLSARSWVLSTMLEETEKDCLILSDIEPDILKILLDYMYCAVLNVSDIKILIDVYKAAEKFTISRLREKCSRVIRDNLMMETVWDVLSLADDYNDQMLTEAALSFVHRKVNIFEENTWKDLRYKRPFDAHEVGISPEEICSQNKQVSTLLQIDENEKGNLLSSNEIKALGDDVGKSTLSCDEGKNI